jgi:hypothetical protein
MSWNVAITIAAALVTITRLTADGVRGCGCEIAGVDAKTEMAAEMAANQGVFDFMIVSFNAAEAMQGGPYSQSLSWRDFPLVALSISRAMSRSKLKSTIRQ